jgi:predicted transcriptional regulator
MNNLKEKTLLELLNHNCMVKTMKGSFDIVARKDEKVVFIKVVEDANSIPASTLEEMKNTAAALRAAPCIISTKAGTKLKDNVLYTRHNITTLNINTLKTSLKKTPVYFTSKKAGITASIDGKKLKQLREHKEISLGKLSRSLGISKRMLVKYEQDNAEVSVHRAIKMMNMVGEHSFKSRDIFSTVIHHPTELTLDISTKYDHLGFNVTETKKVPFDIVAKKDKILILTKIGDNISNDLNNISHAMGVNDLAIVEKKKPDYMPALTKEEFLDMERARTLIKFVREYQ